MGKEVLCIALLLCAVLLPIYCTFRYLPFWLAIVVLDDDTDVVDSDIFGHQMDCQICHFRGGWFHPQKNSGKKSGQNSSQQTDEID